MPTKVEEARRELLHWMPPHAYQEFNSDMDALESAIREEEREHRDCPCKRPDLVWVLRSEIKGHDTIEDALRAEKVRVLEEVKDELQKADDLLGGSILIVMLSEARAEGASDECLHSYPVGPDHNCPKKEVYRALRQAQKNVAHLVEQEKQAETIPDGLMEMRLKEPEPGGERCLRCHGTGIQGTNSGFDGAPCLACGGKERGE